MPLTTLKPTTRAVSIMIGTVEHDTVLDSVAIRSDAPEIEEIVFANENTSGDHSVGTERLTISFGGPLKHGAPEAVPFIPLSSYQNKAFTIHFHSTGGATPVTTGVSGNLNMISAGPSAIAGGAGRSAATARSTGAFTVSWPIA